ncbi:MAG: lytic transglycosylase domain-containing protein, partial [Deltaproteobacteria bacterium]|nr:lytic transglycosylase domain-containing protein [Deltaproteobacteria bacterium]
MIKAESDFDPRVVSYKGAKGLMQIMPVVQKDMGIKHVFDPRENILGGTRLLRYLANFFKGDMILTIAGYHAGPNAVKKYGGIPPYKTTRVYVPRVLK